MTKTRTANIRVILTAWLSVVHIRWPILAMSHFFAYLSRMKHIQRWGLMRNTTPENIQEHSHQVAVIAHGLAVIRNRCFGGSADAQRAALLATFHDAGEVITGDLPTPIKTYNPEIKTAYKKIEGIAAKRLLSMLPEELRADYESILCPCDEDAELWRLVKAADKLCAYFKCIEERMMGNQSFEKAEQAIREQLDASPEPEVAYFLEHCVPSFSLTLDELN